MAGYWDAFPTFDPNPTAPLHAEFARLAALKHWAAGSKNYRKQWARCCALEFGQHYGRESGKLDGWQALCREVGIRDIPTSITACKKILKRTWVNLVDLLDARRTGQPVKRHASRNALRKYSIDNEKIFPKEQAKANGFLAALLIEMF